MGICNHAEQKIGLMKFSLQKERRSLIIPLYRTRNGKHSLSGHPDMKKRKVLVVCLSVVVITLLGCEHTPQTYEPPATSDVSPSVEEVDKPKTPPILEEYFSVYEDVAVSVTNPIAEINKDLEKRIVDGEIVELTNGDCLDLNGDGIGEVINLEIISGGNSFANCLLTVANRQIDIIIENPTGEFYATMLSNSHQGIQLLIDGDGASGDPHAHILEYQSDRLWHIGEITNQAQNITLTQNGFSGYKRGKVMQTWYHPVDYILARALSYNEYVPSRIVEVPRDIYPMGTVVTLLDDLPLQSSRTNSDISFIIKSGLDVCLVATDNKEWVYISPAGNSQYDGGWIQLKKGSYDTLLIDGKELSAKDLFEGLSSGG